MKRFPRIIYKGLETQKAMDLLNLPIENFETKIPILPSGGEIYLFRAKTHRDIDSWRKDGYRWCNRGTSVMTINRTRALRKSFFYLITNEGQNNGFQKHVYRLFDNETKVVIHYLGDETLNTGGTAPTKEPKNLFPYSSILLPSTLKVEHSPKGSASGKKEKPETSEVCSNHFVDGCPSVMNPIPTLNIEPPKDKESRNKSGNNLKLTFNLKPYKSMLESLNKTQEEYEEQQQQQPKIGQLTETLERSPNTILEQVQCIEESRNEKLLKAMLYQMSPQSQSKPPQKINISAALGKPVNNERIRKSPLNPTSSNNSTLSSQPIEIESDSPPAKKPREIHIDIDVSEDESTVPSKPFIQPTIDPPGQKSMKPTVTQSSSSVVHNSVLDMNVPQKQKRILVVPNHHQSVMSNLSSLWKAGRLCDAFISNGAVNVKFTLQNGRLAISIHKVHKMILGAVCPKVLDVFYNTPQHKLPKVTFPSSVSKEGLLAFAEYMYNGVLDLDPDLLYQMKIIAQRLDMKDFEQLCSNQLKSLVVPNTLPTILEPMLSEPCSSSGLIQQMSSQSIQTSLMERIPASKRAYQKGVHIVDSLNSISTTANNCSNSISLSNLPLVEVRTETDDILMEVINNDLAVPSIVNNICDINVNNRPQVKIEKVEPDEQHYGKEVVLSNIDYSTSDNIIISNFTHLPHTDLSQPSSSTSISSSHTNNTTLKKHLPVDQIWTQNNKEKGNLVGNVKPADPYPISLFTSNWANVPLHTQDIKKEYTVE